MRTFKYPMLSLWIRTRSRDKTADKSAVLIIEISKIPDFIKRRLVQADIDLSGLSIIGLDLETDVLSAWESTTAYVSATDGKFVELKSTEDEFDSLPESDSDVDDDDEDFEDGESAADLEDDNEPLDEVPVVNLEDVVYQTNPEFPLVVYIYRSDGKHTGGIWCQGEGAFKRQLDGPIKAAIADHREVRVTDGGDFMVFHSKDGKIIFPRS